MLDKLAVYAADLAILDNARAKVGWHEPVLPQVDDQVIVRKIDQRTIQAELAAVSGDAPGDVTPSQNWFWFDWLQNHPEPNVGVGFVDLSGIDDPPPMGDDRAAVRLKHAITRDELLAEETEITLPFDILAGSGHKLLPLAVIGNLGAAEEVVLAIERYLSPIDKPLLVQSLPGYPG